MRRAWVALLSVACGAPAPAPPSTTEQSETCIAYQFTRVLPGAGTDASVAPDGSIVAVSELDGLHSATVLDQAGTVLGSFALDPFTSLVRIANGGAVVAAAADGRVRRFAPDGRVRFTTELGHALTDLAIAADGSVIATGAQTAGGFVSYLDATGRVTSTSSVRTAPFVVVDPDGYVALTSRDACTASAPCGADFDPNQDAAAPAADVDGSQTSAVVLLDPAHHTTGGFIASVNAENPVGPLLIRSGLFGADKVVVQASASSAVRLQTTIDVDPGAAVALREVDTEATPDHLLGFSGRNLSWDRAVETLDDSRRAYVVALFANRQAVVIDINGDVYKTHHLLLLAADGTVRLRYDKPNDGIANDVRLAGIDDAGHIVLSGRFDGTQDFDPSAGRDVQTASTAARRYVTVVAACPR